MPDPTDPTPYTPTDDDMEDRYVRDSLALVDFPRGGRDEWEQKLRAEVRRGLARVRAEAVREARGSFTLSPHIQYAGTTVHGRLEAHAESIEQETQP